MKSTMVGCRVPTKVRNEFYKYCEEKDIDPGVLLRNYVLKVVDGKVDVPDTFEQRVSKQLKEILGAVNTGIKANMKGTEITLDSIGRLNNQG